MKTYTCDLCGFQKHERGGIVGKEFDRHGFQTLAPSFRRNGVVDVCGPCFETLQSQYRAFKRSEEQATQSRARGLFARLLNRSHESRGSQP